MSKKGGETMRIGPKDKVLWVVTDPTPESGMGDILFQASLEDLYNQFRGGLTLESNPTLFTEKSEAEIEAYGRLVAMRASQAISRMGPETRFQKATKIQVFGANEELLFEADL